HRGVPGLFQVDMDDLADGVPAGVGAASGVHAQGLAAEGQDRALDRALDGGLVGLGLEAVIGPAVILDQEAVARHQPSPTPAEIGNPRRKSSAPCALRPSRWARRMRTAPLPQAMSSRSSSTWPGAPWPSSTVESRALMRMSLSSTRHSNQAPVAKEPSVDAASDQGPGGGRRAANARAKKPADLVQSMRASLDRIFL